MLNSFLNPWMLVGLAGLLLPVIAHLLSRKKYDLVEWGAMQFLEIDPSAKRKVRLEELLLLLVRMTVVALVVVALARPWIGSQWLGGYVSMQPRDVVLVIDGSYSMDWQSQPMTPRSRALQLARQFLKDLLPGDTIQLIDAREQPQLVLPEITRDAYQVREAINNLPAPAGSADLAAAISKAIQLLSIGANLHREVVVFTDMQAFGWKVDDQSLWARIDDVRSQSPISPRIWVVDTALNELGDAPNFTVGRLHLSRELAVSGIPVKLAGKVKYSGGDAPASRKVYLEIDQQRLNDQTLQLKIPPNGETSFEFEYRFESPGSHLMSVVLDDDPLPGDNRAEAVLMVTESLPVLLIDGDPQADPIKSETYFAAAALRSEGDERPWIKATVITPDQLNVDRLKSVSIAVLANVASLEETSIEALREFAFSGHGVLFTLGNRVEKDRYQKLFSRPGEELLPCRLDSVVGEDGKDQRVVRIASDSLELPWLRPFRSDQGGSLSDARWSHWWKVIVPELTRPAKFAADAPPADHPGVDQDSGGGSVPVGTSIIEIRLNNGNPLLVSRRFGRGMIAVLTSSIDADWGTLPAKQDYVPFLHELLFSLAAPTAARNVNLGSPLVLSVSAQLNVDEFQFLSPANKPLPAERLDDPFQPTVRLRTTPLPGVYRFARKLPKPNDANRPEFFAVNFDRSESRLAQLTRAERETLSGTDRMKFVEDLPDLRQNMFAETSRAELWWLLLYVFLASLAVETWMTRRMVRGGYATSATEST